MKSKLWVGLVVIGAVACAGDDGEMGEVGLTSLIDIVAEPAGANCENGGQAVTVGVDDDRDGVLDPEEVDSTSYVCNSAGAAGAATLVSLTDEPAGANCMVGGQRVDSGVDDNANGTLDADEIDTTTYVCDGSNGLVSLIDVTDEPAGANCADGGQRIDTGVDDSGDGVLDAGEIDSTMYVCDGPDGAVSLVDVTTELPGANCNTGGQRVDTGIDDDASGTLEPAEIDQTAYVCSSVEPRYLYLANWAAFNTDFDAFDIENRTWIAAADLPVTSRGQIASTGTTVIMLGTDNNVYEYDITGDAWTMLTAGPSTALTSFSYLGYLNGKIYACQQGTTNLNVYDGAWSTVALGIPCSVAGGVDVAAGEIYIKRRNQSGFVVIDGATDTVLRTITDTASISENTSSAAVLAGAFFVRSISGNIFNLDGLTGEKINTGIDPTGNYNAMVGDPGQQVVYVHSSVGFDIYDPGRGSLRALPTGPTQSTLGTIALTY